TRNVATATSVVMVDRGPLPLGAGVAKVSNRKRTTNCAPTSRPQRMPIRQSAGVIRIGGVYSRIHRPNRPNRPHLSKSIQNRHFLMARAQVLGQQVEVALRRRNLRVAQHHRQPHDVATLAEVVRCEGVAETVPAEHRQTEPALHQVERRRAVALLPARCARAHEYEWAAEALLLFEPLESIQPLA